MKKELTLGSLFDGSGGFPLAGLLSGIRPVWASEIEPFPIRVTTKRLPDMKHYGDVSKISGADIEPVDIITFGSPCFPAGTLVLTEKGYVPIEKVRVGARVLTHEGRWKRVTATGSKLGETVILKGNHYGLECTPNHPIFSTGERKYYPHISPTMRANKTILLAEKGWIPAEKMKGRLWAIPNSVESLPISPPPHEPSGNEKPMPPMDERFFYFIGRWLGDGWVRIGQRPHRPHGQTFGNICLCDSFDKEEELRAVIESVSKNCRVSKEKTAVRFCFTSKILAEWLAENFGQYAHNKTMPGWVFALPEGYKRNLLEGLIDSDGYRIAGNKVRISTVSKKLAESIRLLGEMQGYSTTVHLTNPAQKKLIEGRLVNQRPYYTVALTEGKKREHLKDDKHGWYRVRSIEPTNEVKVVYNMTVEDDNSYIADGIVVHNCQDLSVAGKREGIEQGQRSSLFFEAIRIIKEMRVATNGRYPTFIVWENVPGALSSGGGQDFRRVLEEVCSVKNADVSIPRPAKWSNAGEIVGDGFSIAWRLFNAQYWGVAQRRRRVYLVGDFAGERAGKILFESEGVRGYSPQNIKAWKRTTADTEASVRAASEGISRRH